MHEWCASFREVYKLDYKIDIYFHYTASDAPTTCRNCCFPLVHCLVVPQNCPLLHGSSETTFIKVGSTLGKISAHTCKLTIGDKRVEKIVENRTVSRKSVVHVKFQAPSSPIRCWRKSSSQEQHCMGEGCVWRFWLIVYRHLSLIYVFYEFSQEVLSLIVGSFPTQTNKHKHKQVIQVGLQNWNIFPLYCFRCSHKL